VVRHGRSGSEGAPDRLDAAQVYVRRGEVRFERTPLGSEGVLPRAHQSDDRMAACPLGYDTMPVQ